MNKFTSTLCLTMLAMSPAALMAQSGSDPLDNLKVATEFMRIIDSGLFHWVGRLMAGICILSAGWALKEQKFSVAVVCLLGAMLFGTAVKWVKNVFSMGGDAKGLFNGSMLEQQPKPSDQKLYLVATDLISGVRNA